MQTIYHAANTRGHANYGWLDTSHTFSFSHYYNPERMRFGMLRVLNDDVVAPGMGFGTHPHENMEIISIPLEGALEHKDSMGHVSVLRKGEIQVMSAGTGLQHSEYNHSKTEAVHFLQLWIMPEEQQVKPRYDQQPYDLDFSKNDFTEVVGPKGSTSGLWVHQQAWINLGLGNAGTKLSYSLHNPQHGVYVFVIEGECMVGEQKLYRRDGLAVWDTNILTLECLAGDTQLLLIEIPLS